MIDVEDEQIRHHYNRPDPLDPTTVWVRVETVVWLTREQVAEFDAIVDDLNAEMRTRYESASETDDGTMGWPFGMWATHGFPILGHSAYAIRFALVDDVEFLLEWLHEFTRRVTTIDVGQLIPYVPWRAPYWTRRGRFGAILMPPVVPRPKNIMYDARDRDAHEDLLDTIDMWALEAGPVAARSDHHIEHLVFDRTPEGLRQSRDFPHKFDGLGFWSLSAWDDPNGTARSHHHRVDHAQVCLLTGWDHKPVRDRVDALTPLLLATADHVNTAAIPPNLGRHNAPKPLNWAFGDTPAGVHTRDIRSVARLLHNRVVAPCGVQVVSDAHLERANDLSNWNVTSLGDQRHLITAPDITPWYAPPIPLEPPKFLPRWERHHPPDDLYQQALTDFGDMIITQHDVDTHHPDTH